MLFVYGSSMPLRWLEEIRFWKMQEREHTVVIRAVVPGLEPPFVRTLQAWEPVFAAAERCADSWLAALCAAPERLPGSAAEQTEMLLRVAKLQSEAFIRQLLCIREQSAAVRRNPVAPVVLDHIIRESQYFLCAVDEAAALGVRPGAQPNAAAEAAEAPAWPQAEWLGAYAPSAGGPAAVPEREAAPAPSGTAGPPPADGGSAYAAGERAREEAAVVRLHVRGESPPAAGGAQRAPADDSRAVPIGGHRLPPLPYPYNALEPHIDAETMRIHHDRHHQSYVDGLNRAEKELQQARRNGDFGLVKHWERELAFHGAGHYLHTLFWNVMAPGGGGAPSGPLADAIKRDFGSFEAFRKQFTAAANAVEGGGWAILVWSPRSRRLEILQAEKHQNLSQWDVVPLLPLDVWEHAYYLKHRNDRAAYVDAWWNVVNWPYVDRRFQAAETLKWEPF